MMVVVEEQSVAMEYVTLLSQFLVQKSVMWWGRSSTRFLEMFTAELMLSSNMVVVGGLDNKPIKTVKTG